MKTLEALISATHSFESGIQGNNVMVFVSEMQDFTGKLEQLGFTRHFGFDHQEQRKFATSQWYRSDESEGTYEAVFTTDGKKWTFCAQDKNGKIGVVGIEEFQGMARYIVNL
jgi:hypothetical protein